MKKFNNPYKNIVYFIYRMIKSIFDHLQISKGIWSYIWYIRDLISFMFYSREKIRLINLYPVLEDKIDFLPFDAHYFFQQLWVFENILKVRPQERVDVGSTFEMTGYISKITKAKFEDIRPIATQLGNLEVVIINIFHLAFNKNLIKKLLYLHAREHISLGRCEDLIDPDGLKKICNKLKIVLAPNDIIYLSKSIGKDTICFNEHRVSFPLKIINMFNHLKLLSFDVVDDDENYLQDVDVMILLYLNYAYRIFYKRAVT